MPAAATRTVARPVAEPEYYTAPAVARILGVQPESVHAMIRGGGLVASDIGRGSRPRYRIHRDDLTEFMRRRAVSGTPAASRRPRSTPGEFY